MSAVNATDEPVSLSIYATWCGIENIQILVICVILVINITIVFLITRLYFRKKRSSGRRYTAPKSQDGDYEEVQSFGQGHERSFVPMETMDIAGEAL